MVSGLPPHYRVERKLGSGGMADVYLGWNEDLRRFEALKFLAPRFVADRSLSQRFLNEARIAASLHHPNIAAIYTVSAPAAPNPYFAMQYVSGGDLADRLASGTRMALEEARALLAQIAAALDHAHAQGIVHRDMKPANVLVEGTGGGLHAYVTDFGIARAQGADPTSRLTQAGMIVGTPEYMAPEQANGADAGPRADQYALATVAYEILTGRVPFPSESHTSAIAILVEKTRRTPHAPSTLRPGLPKAVDQALLRGLAIRPEHRFASCRDLVDAMSQSSGPRRAPLVLGGLALAGVAMVGLALARSQPAADLPVAPPKPGKPPVQPPILTTVPNVVGMSTGEADRALRSVGLSPATETAYCDDTPTGNIDRQEPVAGAQASPSATVSLVASLGPKPLPTVAETPEAPAPPPPVSREEDESRLREKLSAWRDAWIGNHLDEFLGHYDPDATITSSNGNFLGFAAWSAVQRKMFADPGRLNIEVVPKTIRVDGDEARIEFEEHFQRLGGFRGSFESRVRDRWRLRRSSEGGWKIVEDRSTLLKSAKETLRADPSDYYSVDVPAGWSKVETKNSDGYTTKLSAPDPNVFVKIQVSVPASAPTALEAWQKMHQAYDKPARGYSLVRLEASTVAGLNGAVWEFEHRPATKTVRYHKRDLGLVFEGRGYALLSAAPVDEYSEYEGRFRSIEASFKVR